MGYHWMTSRFKSMKRRNSLFCCLSFFLLLFFFSLFAFLNSTNSSLGFRCQIAAKADFLSQVFEKTLRKSTENSDESKLKVEPMSLARVRRILFGLGSSPPRCSWKCGRCTPCRPVHVPVPPGVPVTTEYYPEAWRCKCGNRLYMP